MKGFIKSSSRLLKNPQECFDKLLCGCQAHYIRGLFFSYDSFTSRPKRDLLLCVARHRAVTLTRNAPLSKAQSPGISVSRIEPFREFPLPVLPVVASFPGAMSPLGSKDPNEPFLSPHKVFVASRPQKSARCVCAPLQQWRPWTPPCGDGVGKPSGKIL